LLVLGLLVVSFKDSTKADINETNLSNEINETNLSMLLNAPLETNTSTSLENNITEVNTTTPTPVAPIEVNTTVAVPNGAIKFEFTPKRKLWLGIYYLNEDNKSDLKDNLDTTVQLNSLRPQLIHVGPAFFTIKLGDTVIDSNIDKPARYLYDPKERKLKYITKEEFEAIRPAKKP
ncbi:MAG: hypothetical protein RL154_192, partial [Pseudomonadota bacterium]